MPNEFSREKYAKTCRKEVQNIAANKIIYFLLPLIIFKPFALIFQTTITFIILKLVQFPKI
jgi:hypothetical protein